MNSQQLILDQIAAAVGTHDGVMLIHDPHWANTGTLRVLDRETLTQIGATTYDFEQNYVHFGPVTDRVAALWYGQSSEGNCSWVKGSIPELVEAVVAHLLNKREAA